MNGLNCNYDELTKQNKMQVVLYINKQGNKNSLYSNKFKKQNHVLDAFSPLPCLPTKLVRRGTRLNYIFQSSSCLAIQQSKLEIRLTINFK